jgi:4-hydroxybenzoate polyprenyltransferase
MTRTLAGSCHPVPSLAVTVFLTSLGVAAGNSTLTCTVLAIAVAAGQLSIGWSNDRIDVALDRSSRRTDKPLVHDVRALRLVDAAIAVALTVTIAASLALGWRAGLLHLIAVGFGWSYNLGLKRTVLSWLPYAAAFGAAPGIATLALAQHAAPAAWAVAAAALLGVTAHLTNALPDLVADRAFGVVGLPHRLGARATTVLGAVTAWLGSAVLVLGPGGGASLARWCGLAAATLLIGAGLAYGWRRPASRALFYATLGVVALDLVLLFLGPGFAG